ncbi:MAG: DNA recombination protein RmuC [Candidatus Omnitrophota bacterium]|nr:MAG: DNA recombination protein RmuC [Candidatus Omnitrophota bacterium]
MIETLLIMLIVLAVINIFIGLKMKDLFDLKPHLKEVEGSILKFDSTLEQIEKSIKDEFQRNRMENNEVSKMNRDELTKSLNLFGEQFSANVKGLNELLNEKFIQQNNQQIEFNKQTSDSTKTNRAELLKSLKSFEDNFSEKIKGLNELLRQKFGDFNKQQIDVNKLSTDNIKNVEKTIEKQLESIRQDNTIQLNEMRKTVDEKLQNTLEKRLGESFKQVSDRLEQVHKGLGEMQNIASGVGDLKKVLSNVKTRGVLGEYQLENILEQILTPEQYAKNVATKRGSQANVEFALKLPGKESDKEVWLPIDSKFPIEDYHTLLEAFNRGDKIEIENSQKALIKKIENFAKNISEKYIDPPHTTDFCIMFLPVESLYAEVLRHPGLFEILQRKYKITVTGPTTLSALLNSLQMGFRTLAVQKRSSEVWDILKAVKFEFKEFSGVLTKVHKQLNTASGTLETLRRTRTSVMEKKLKNVETFTAIESKKILELPDDRVEELDDE